MCAELPSKSHREESGTDLPSESVFSDFYCIFSHLPILKSGGTLWAASRVWFQICDLHFSPFVFSGWENSFFCGPYVSFSVFTVSRWNIFVVLVEFQRHSLCPDAPVDHAGPLIPHDHFFNVTRTLMPSISLLLGSVFSSLPVAQSLFALISAALNNSQGSCPRGKGPQTCLDH